MTTTTTHDRSRASLRALLAAALTVLLTAAGATVAHADQAADEVATRVNQERAAHGRGALARDAALDSAATEWARHMATAQVFEHSTNRWRMDRARPGWSLCCGENIAAGQPNAQAVMTGWMNSTGHRANILDARYSHIGVGHVNVPGSPYGRYWVQIFATYQQNVAGDQAFVRQLYRDFLGREARQGDVDHWVGHLGSGMTRYDVATATARTPEWIRSVITEFYRDTLGREPDAAGLAGWVRAAQQGMPMAQIASAFYGSPEYYATIGRNDPETWVRDLYPKLLLRAPDAPGVRHWVGQLRNGVPRAQVAHSFYQSLETARVRVDGVYRELLDRPADPAGLRTWPPVVLAQGDLALAAWIASSEEYYAKARRG